eukprot:scaffold348051_cov19-Prasinocladus_malaysianus.AAC.1
MEMNGPDLRARPSSKTRAQKSLLVYSYEHAELRPWHNLLRLVTAKTWHSHATPSRCSLIILCR